MTAEERLAEVLKACDALAMEPEMSPGYEDDSALFSTSRAYSFVDAVAKGLVTLDHYLEELRANSR